MHCGPKKIKMSPEIKASYTKIGSSKQAKLALDISTIPAKRYYRLKSLAENIDPSIEHPFQAEADLGLRFGEHAAPLEYCVFYQTKKGGVNAVAYSKAAYCSLYTLIGEAGLVYDNQPVSMLLRFKLIKDIFSCVLKIHKDKCVHQDLKPQNILVYKIIDPVTMSMRFSAKLCDFGNAVSLAFAGEKFGASYSYAAPEVFSGSLDPQYSRHHYYHKSNFECFSYGQHCYLNSDPRYFCLSTHQAISKKQDVWTLGLIVYEILWGHLNIKNTDFKAIQVFEKRVKLDPLLAVCLALDPAQRINVKVALQYIDAVIENMQTKPKRGKLPTIKP